MTRTATIAALSIALLAPLSPGAAFAAHGIEDGGSASPASSPLVIRSQALDQQLHLNASVTADRRSPDTRDAAVSARGTGAAPQSVTSPAPADGFDWTATGVGLSGVAAAFALILGGAALARRRPTPRTS